MSVSVKIIIIKDKSDTHLINSEFKLYELYNDWLQDHDAGLNVLDETTLQRVEAIRDCNRSVFEAIPSGEYSLEEFEILAMKAVYQ